MELFSSDLLAVVGSFVENNQLTLIAALINFVWVWLEYRASMWLWPVGIVLPLFYIVVSWQAHYYGNVLINVYYLVTSIIGWYMWLRRGAEVEEGRIRAVPERALWQSLAVAVPLYGVLWWLLASYTDSVCAPVDALATTISFVGMIWLAKRWREHWLCWTVANGLSAWLFYLSEDYVSLVVFACNFVIAILGYIEWIKLSREQADATLSKA